MSPVSPGNKKQGRACGGMQGGMDGGPPWQGDRSGRQAIDAVGVVPPRSSQEFLDLLNTAPVIIAKGKANFESLGGSDYNVYFHFKVKCPMVADITGLPVGSKLVYNEHL